MMGKILKRESNQGNGKIHLAKDPTIRQKLVLFAG
jgi:hypothetical protein